MSKSDSFHVFYQTVISFLNDRSLFLGCSNHLSFVFPHERWIDTDLLGELTCVNEGECLEETADIIHIINVVTFILP